MTNDEERPRPGFRVEAKLTGVQPKAGKNDYSGRDPSNSIVLTLEVRLPRPVPPTTFDAWVNQWGGDGGSQIKRDIESRLNVAAEKLKKAAEGEKLPSAGAKPKHWFDVKPTDEAGVNAVCRHCGKDGPDGDKCLDPDAFRQRRKDELDGQVEALQREAGQQLRERYDTYFRTQSSKLNQAFAAQMGTGLFVAMLGQDVDITLTPSSDLFQPMLDATFAVQKLLPGGTDAPPVQAQPDPEDALDLEEGEEGEDD